MTRDEKGQSRRAAVLGSPISHSLSPAMHRAAYMALGLTHWRYDAIDCDAAALPDLVTSLGPEWAGLSVTMPGKSAAAAVADRRSRRVELLGVANTLVRTADGWFAENTDVDGVVGSLRAAGMPAPHRVLLIGGGGTALAAVAALHEIGSAATLPPELVIAVRRVGGADRALELAETLGLHATTCSLEQVRHHAEDVELVMSTVPAGAADDLADDIANVPTLFDAIYHPWPTPLAAAGSADRRTVTGLDMLLHQAFAQVELMVGRPAPKEQMRDSLRAATNVRLDLPY